MSYIWEDRNRGKSLFEMAVESKRAIVEATFNLRDAEDETKNTVIDSLKKALGLPDADFAAKVKIVAGPTPDKAVLEISDDVLSTPKGKHAVEFLQQKSFVVDPDADKKRGETETNNKEAVIKSLIGQLPTKDDELKNDVAFAVRCISNGLWFDGSKIDPADTGKAEIAARFKKAVLGGNIETARGCLSTLAGSISSGRIEVDPNNPGLYRTKNKDKQVTGNIQMPAMFDSEPDDSMWNEMIINDYGVPMINMSHPAVRKVIASDNPEEDCPGDLKAFKKQIYADKNLQKVFGKGGFDRVILDKAMNLLTLGIAAKTVDSGKRADRIIKELKEKGGRATNRNLLVVPYEEIVDADPNNAELTITVKSYNRSRKEFSDEFEVPASMLAKFYCAVDPVNSPRIYVDVAAKAKELGHEAAGKALVSSVTEAGAPVLMEANAQSDSGLGTGTAAGLIGAAAGGLGGAATAGIGAVAGAAGRTAWAGLSNELAGDKNDRNSVSKVEKNDGSGYAEVQKEFINKISEEGHPDFYVLKPKSKNKEVDVISRAGTGHLHGGKVLMVSMKVEDHQAAMFMTPKQVKEYFSV